MLIMKYKGVINEYNWSKTVGSLLDITCIIFTSQLYTDSMTMTTYDNIFKNCLKIYSHNKCHYYKTNENHTILAVVFLGGLMETQET